MTEPLATADDGANGHGANNRRVPRRGRFTRLLAALSVLLAVAALALLGLWLVLLSPYGYTPPTEAPRSTEAPGWGDAQARPVFVYGTLRQPILRRLVIGRAVETREAVLPGYRKERLNIVPDPQALTRGEVVHVQIDELARLDRYERLGERYERLWLQLDDGSHAWVYRRLDSP